eukprot:CAMPEP_0177687464 /NCGR_PEP_ID=MMETSP0447-20121125/34145_1 /TAXON_ID=0 /ORGANISM="Stygamoeba regulata, Strain BSH-02190019" /LENGTH=156 /DNA_ID=CAMNT_0019197713 /DNA_START=314 /DNA_END=784 /DNA_ORIENTATION=-
MACCRRTNKPTGLDPLLQSVDHRLRQVRQLFPHPRTCALVRVDGQVLASCSEDYEPGQNEEELQANNHLIEALVRIGSVSDAFAESLGEDQVTAFHISGTTTFFSYFPVGEKYFVVLFSDQPHGKDMGDVDSKVEEICEDIRLLLFGQDIQAASDE